MSAQVQVLIRSNQTRYATVYCDDCRYDSRDTMGSRDLTETEATDLAAFHDEVEHDLDAHENRND